jgi:formylglycine-generating enzyme required for sulfatase activity
MVARSSAVVVCIAAATGVILARGADAGPQAAATTSSTAPAASILAPAAAGSTAVVTTPLSHDESEPDDQRASAADNPYDEPAQKPAMAHLPMLVREGMVRLQGGRFVMGSSSPRAPVNERPARPVVVTPFWMDRTEVTVGAYRECVDKGACARPERASVACTFDAGDAELPVSCVRWRDADAYCRFAKKRLPSEREWEFAARGPFATPFPWGSAVSCTNAVTLINEQSAKSCASRPAHVGAHPTGASVFGVQDLSGNVEEWTSDWYVESLGPGPAPRSGAAHVLRGGGWLSTPSQSRTTARDWGSALEAGPNVGFRCARDAEP